MPSFKKITQRTINSTSRFIPTINPHGYWKKYIQLRGAAKKISTGVENAYQKFASGSTPGLQLEDREMIKESSNAILRKNATPHENKYMKSPNGKALKQEVNELIRMKPGKKKI